MQAGATPLRRAVRQSSSSFMGKYRSEKSSETDATAALDTMIRRRQAFAGTAKNDYTLKRMNGSLACWPAIWPSAAKDIQTELDWWRSCPPSRNPLRNNGVRPERNAARWP
jgi:hypothetical protein